MVDTSEIRRLQAGKIDKPLVEPTDGQALIYNAATKRYEGGAGGGGGGVTDHGALTGLADDDHSQYYNASRLNAWAGSSAITTIGTLIAGSIPVSLITGLGTLATQSGTFSGTSSGTNTGDQTITLTGDVTGSGTGSFAATITNDAVTFAKMQTITDARLLGRSAGADGDCQHITVGSGLSLSGGELSATGASSTGSFGITIDGGGSAITTGLKGFVRVPYNCTITGWEIYADQTGSVVIDVWKDTYANFPPTSLDSIAGSEKPTLSSTQKNQDTSLGTWTTSVTAGDVIAFNVDSATTVTRVNLSINVTKT